ncbi:MAG: hypothetical protein ACFBSF_04430 [Leptolyngbyaceae cyanobacterium]
MVLIIVAAYWQSIGTDGGESSATSAIATARLRLTAAGAIALARQH